MGGVYLDNAATTFPKPPEVYDYMMEMYKTSGVNFGRNKSAESGNIDQIVKDTRKMIKELAKATHEYETIFTPSSTIALNQILFGLDFSNIKNIYMKPWEAINNVINGLATGINQLFWGENGESGLIAKVFDENTNLWDELKKKAFGKLKDFWD